MSYNDNKIVVLLILINIFVVNKDMATKTSIINSLDRIIGRLVDINFKLEGNQLQDAIREVAHIKENIERNYIEIKKFKKTKK